MRGRIVAALVVVAVSGGCVQPESGAPSASDAPAAQAPLPARDPQSTDHGGLAPQDLRRIADALAEPGTARELALAALLRESARVPPMAAEIDTGRTTWRPADDLALVWRQRAGALAGDDTIANVLLILGAGRPDAIAHDAAQRWADAEPDNSAPVWLDGVSFEAQRDRAAQRARHDIAHFAVMRWIRDAMAAHLPEARVPASKQDVSDAPPGTDAALLAVGLFDAGKLLPGSRLMQGCTSSGLDLKDAAACRAIAAQCQGADTLLMQRIGVLLASRMATGPDDPMVAHLQRASAWRNHAMRRAATDDGGRQFARLLDDASIHNESELVERTLQEAGIPLVAPDDWQPPRG